MVIGGDGFPQVAGYDAIPNRAVVHCNDATGASFTTAPVEASGHVGESIAVAIGADGLPVMSYRDTLNADLCVTKCLSRTCQ